MLDDIRVLANSSMSIVPSVRRYGRKVRSAGEDGEVRTSTGVEILNVCV